ncbi:unnamed protein product [Pedinophyceae sp. YPF-701]|nr:unnamed protein product [Pedinophyceae sp. YPF-701]
MGRGAKDKRDIYYRKAKEDGWRARSAFKLLQIDETFDIFSGVRNVIDLCAAPGSWSQVLSRKLYLPAKDAGATGEELPRIVAVDLQPMAPIEGVVQLQGDITTEATARAVVDALGGAPADLVVSDGAPDVTGLHDLDEFVQSQLILACCTIVASVLRPGGSFVAKVFRGREAALLYAQLKVLFADVSIAKPRSSRNSSVEAFVVCRGYAPPRGATAADVRAALADAAAAQGAPGVAEPLRSMARFVACGDLSAYDADRSYDLDPGYERLAPVQPPIAPAYLAAVQRTRQGGAGEAAQGAANGNK